MCDLRIQDCVYLGEEVGMTGEDKCGGMCLDVGYVPVLDWGGGYTGMFTL